MLRKILISFLSLLALLSLVIFLPVSTRFVPIAPASAQQPEPLFILMGSSDTQALQGFVQASIERISGNTVRILVIPLAFSLDDQAIPNDRYAEYQNQAKVYQGEIENICEAGKPTGTRCEVLLLPVFSPAQAIDPDLNDLYAENFSGIFLAGDFPAQALEFVSGTSIAKVLQSASERGTVISALANNISDLSQSSENLQTSAVDTSLDFGAVRVWGQSESTPIYQPFQVFALEKDFFAGGNLAHLLNAITSSNSKHLGIGIGSATGARLDNLINLNSIYGESAVMVLDAETYHAADSVQYIGTRNTLSLRNVLIHILPPGEFKYDLNKRTTLIAPNETLTRSFQELALPSGAGPLILTGSITPTNSSQATYTRFINLSGGYNARILAVIAGFPSENEARSQADRYSAILEVPISTTLVVTETVSMLSIPPDMYTGLLLVVKNPESVPENVLDEVAASWLDGVPLLAAGEGAALLGTAFFREDELAVEIATNESSSSLLRGEKNPKFLQTGLGLIDFAIKPGMSGPDDLALLVRLAYREPASFTFGLSANSALEFSQKGILALGPEPIIGLDFRSAQLGVGANGVISVMNGLLDVFAPSSYLKLEPANMNLAPLPAFTPLITIEPSLIPQASPTLTSTATPTQTPTHTPAPPTERSPGSRPTRTPKPTATPPVVPPPSDPDMTNLMISFGIVTVIVILIGIWINRSRLS